MSSSNLVENQLFDKSFLNKEHNQHLSLQLSLTQLKAAWFDIPSKTYIGFQSFDYNADSNWETIFPHLFPVGKSYQSLSLGLVNNRYTLVPKGIFDASALKSYLQFNLGVGIGSPNYSTVESANAQLVYDEANVVLEQIKYSLPGIKVSHSGKSLLEAFAQEKMESKTNLFVHVQDGRFDVACYKEKQLNFFNSFDFKTTEDFIYFLLYVMEQLNLDRESCPVFFCGEVVEKSAIYELVFKYIRNVELLNRPKLANYSSILSQIPSSFHYSLFNQYLCE